MTRWALLVLVAVTALWLRDVAVGAVGTPDPTGPHLLSLYDVLEAPVGGVATLGKGADELVVAGLPDSVGRGDAITAEVSLVGERWTAAWVEPHPYRHAKKTLGLLGILGTLGLIAGGCTVRDRRLWLRG